MRLLRVMSSRRTLNSPGSRPERLSLARVTSFRQVWRNVVQPPSLQPLDVLAEGDDQALDLDHALAQPVVER
jgi:hypothetical protein